MPQETEEPTGQLSSGQEPPLVIDSSHSSCAICTQDWRFCPVSIEALRASECDLCRIILKAVSMKGPIPERVEIQERRNQGDIKTLEYVTEGQRITLQIAPPSDVSLAIGWSPAGHFETTDRAEAVLRFAREQFTACFLVHERCGGGVENRPDRLIEIMPAHGADIETSSYRSFMRSAEAGNLRFRLIDKASTSPSQSQSLRYACLSYCWGNGLPLQSTKGNFDRLKSGIAWQEFPRTFQEAIAVTCCLGMRFLWIDALCIIQDDRNDWLQQAVQMCKIYGSAELTIAAADAKDCQSGFLDSGQPIWTDREPITCVDMFSKAKFNLSVREWCGRVRWDEYIHTSQYAPVNQMPSEKSVDMHSQVRAFETHILDTRGWAFQEACLSQRILSVASSEAGWECTTVHRCECRESLTTHGTRRMTPRGIVEDRGQPCYTLYVDPWMILIQLYLRRDFTFPSDKLAAISGVARKFMTEEDNPYGDYLAGHWRRQLPLSLGWSVIALSSRSQRPSRYSDTYIAPSWSYASISLPYQIGWFPLLEEEALVAKLLAVECQSSEPDGTGVVTGGFICLDAPVTTTTMRAETSAQSGRTDFRASRLEDFEPFRSVADGEQALQARSITVRLWPDFPPDAPDRPDLSVLVCVWLAAERQPNSNWNWRFSMLACQPAEAGSLRRIGIIHVEYRPWVAFARHTLLSTPLMSMGRKVVTIV